MKIREYISDVRPGSVLLAVSGLVLGVMMAAADYDINWSVALCLILTVISFLTLNTVLPGIALAVATVWLSYGTIFSLEALIMLLLGYFVYRLVHNHSPEDGLYRNGISVTLTSLVVYGLLPVYGSYFVCTHSFGSAMLLLPALSVGSFCLASVNSTFLDDRKTRAFHTFWIIAGAVFMTVYACMRIFDPWHFTYLLVLPLFFLWIVRMWTDSPKMSGYEKVLPVLILTFCLFAGFGFIVYLLY